MIFCSKCGNQLQDGTQFCNKCGNPTNDVATPSAAKEVKIVLDPSEVIVHDADNRKKTTSGHAGTYGIILMLISVIFSLVSMFAIGFDAFIPITIGSSVLFVIGFLMKMFCP